MRTSIFWYDIEKNLVILSLSCLMFQANVSYVIGGHKRLDLWLMSNPYRNYSHLENGLKKHFLMFSSYEKFLLFSYNLRSCKEERETMRSCQ
jgi:hypothetical protein